MKPFNEFLSEAKKGKRVNNLSDDTEIEVHSASNPNDMEAATIGDFRYGYEAEQGETLTFYMLPNGDVRIEASGGDFAVGSIRK